MPKGFAALSPEERARIGSLGGTAAQASGRGNRFTSETARQAGRRAHEVGAAHEFSAEEAAIAGRKGGKAAARSKRVTARDVLELEAALSPRGLLPESTE